MVSTFNIAFCDVSCTDNFFYTISAKWRSCRNNGSFCEVMCAMLLLPFEAGPLRLAIAAARGSCDNPTPLRRLPPLRPCGHPPCRRLPYSAFIVPAAEAAPPLRCHFLSIKCIFWTCRCFSITADTSAQTSRSGCHPLQEGRPDEVSNRCLFAKIVQA